MDQRKMTTMIGLMSGLLVAWAMTAGAAETGQKQPWQELYKGEEATGKNVIALWQFQPGAELKDSSGNGHDLKCRNYAKVVRDDKMFLRGYLSAPRVANPDRPNTYYAVGACAKNHPRLTPAGAFTLEMWICPKPEFDTTPTAMLMDKKSFHYPTKNPLSNYDYCLYLQRTGKHERKLMAHLGYGKDSERYESQAVKLEPTTWRHLAFTYDGAGVGSFYLDGQYVGRTVHAGRGAVSPGRFDLVIGDRYQSSFLQFWGYIGQVRISNGVAPRFKGAPPLTPQERTAPPSVAPAPAAAPAPASGFLRAQLEGHRVFLRMEKGAAIPAVITVGAKKPVRNATATVTLGDMPPKTLRLPEFAPGIPRTVKIPFETSLRPGVYPLKVVIVVPVEGRETRMQRECSIRIVPRPAPNRMPVILWGSGAMKDMVKCGFTHQTRLTLNNEMIWSAGKPIPAAMNAKHYHQMLRESDDTLANGLRMLAFVYPGYWLSLDENRHIASKYWRVDRDGRQRWHKNVSGHFPEVQKFGFNAGASCGLTFGQHAAFDGAGINSELRDRAEVSFHPIEREAFKKHAGYDIPEQVVDKRGIAYGTIKGFPANRVVRDDNHILTFYKWYWKDGDGWNILNREVDRGLKSTARDGVWTWFDPAVRCKSVWGNGAGLDVVSHWSYPYPDPIKMGTAVDELLAMADGTGQKVMKMTQIITYRSQVAPKLPENKTQWAQWEKDYPKAKFITVPPDGLREAFWCKIARPIKGIMYFGSPCLWPGLDRGPGYGHYCTNLRTKDVLAELTREVVRPLGPMLVQVPDRPSDVALLESFASQVFAGRGTGGWTGWEFDMHQVLQWAHIQSRTIYEETILRDGLDAFKVLVMPHCDVLPKGVVTRVQEFQDRGGIVVADQFLCPAITPDILVERYERKGVGDKDKAALQRLAGKLREELDPLYKRYGDASSPDVVIRFRRYKDADYLFAINDKRTYGNYVGHHRKIMEKGLPNTATLSISRKTGVAYDLVAHKPVPTSRTDSGLELKADLGPGGGRLFMITQRAVAGVVVETAGEAHLGERFDINVAVVDKRKKPLSAIVPVYVEIIDPQGRAAEFTGYYGARDGKLTITLDLAANHPPGVWKVRATELASGLTQEGTFKVRAGTR